MGFVVNAKRTGGIILRKTRQIKGAVFGFINSKVLNKDWGRGSSGKVPA
jgi:hypothetical protein